MALSKVLSGIAKEKAKAYPKAISAKERAKTATVHAGGQAKFPIPDKKHARLALAMEGRAKPPLTAAQKKTVTSKANAMLGKSA